ncbi:mammalian cell entry protein [Mycobacteriaceae bacterium 1482268.1]|nr:mammalian cell entry protein [Mycobacteriaceae bacterium 1482268.1]
MTRNRLLTLVLAALLAVALVGGVVVVLQQTFFKPKTITAYFTKTVAIYPGDEVRIAGVKVGGIDSIEPIGTQAKMTLHVDRGISVPADAKAVIVAQNLISARYVQLAPAYESGPTMGDGAVIPLNRTAIPVEWDEVKEQLMRLASELGPDKGVSTGSVGRFIDSAANALNGNGDKLRQTLAQLSGVGRILADGSGNIVDTISNLQTFVTALRDSNNQIVQFQNNFATLTSVLNDSTSDLDAALKDLSEVVGETQRFIAGIRDKTAEQVRLLGDVTQTLADHKLDLENVLHIAPHAIANAYNMFDPRTGAASGVFVLNNLSRPTWAICTMIGALENVTSPESGKLCSQYVGRALNTIDINSIPLPFNPFLTSNPPEYMLRYTEDRLRPENEGQPPPPPTDPPAISAYTGLNGDVPPPPGYGPPPGPSLPMAPAPAPPSPTLQDMLLPAEAPPPAGDGTPP